MSTLASTVTWKTGMAFQVDQDGHRFLLDGSPALGGLDLGPRPKELLLSALGGCTGIDVVEILKKMRVPLEGLEVRLSADTTEEHPKVFTAIRLEYVFRGKELPLDKLERAVQLSRERYCGVSAMLEKACPIHVDIRVEA